MEVSGKGITLFQPGRLVQTRVSLLLESIGGIDGAEQMPVADVKRAIIGAYTKPPQAQSFRFQPCCGFFRGQRANTDPHHSCLQTA